MGRPRLEDWKLCAETVSCLVEEKREREREREKSSS